jgi:hypothetical protein
LIKRLIADLQYIFQRTVLNRSGQEENIREITKPNHEDIFLNTNRSVKLMTLACGGSSVTSEKTSSEKEKKTS